MQKKTSNTKPLQNALILRNLLGGASERRVLRDEQQQRKNSKESHYAAVSMRIEAYIIAGPDQPLTYAVGEAHAPLIQLGSLVKVPLGKRSLFGVVKRILEPNESVPFALKPIQEVFYPHPVTTQDLIQLIPWMKSYYAASMEATLGAFVPLALKDPVQDKTINYVEFLPEGGEPVRAKSKQAILLEALKEAKRIDQKALLAATNISSAVLKSLVTKGWAKVSCETTLREAYEDHLMLEEMAVAASEPPPLNLEQQAAFEALQESLLKGEFAVHLLHGVTGSGKTEVYMAAAKVALEQGHSVLFLVPEVALTPQTLGRLRARFGARVLVWHNQLSAGERKDAWLMMARGEARLVVGARSAIFAPLPQLKLIIVDEEHDTAYKQEDSPRYHGRDVAVYRAKLAQAVCVLGSATPSLESLYNVSRKRYQINTLKQRIDDRILPPMHIVDMRLENKNGKGIPLISRLLWEKLADRLEKKEQSILFLNRRGFANKLQCPDCGHVLECPHCSISLTYHRTHEALRCHLCHHERPWVAYCPNCKSKNLHQKRAGTQRIEDLLPKLFPSMRLARIDADLMQQKHTFRDILSQFRKGKIDTLIGTQMIAKGLDFPNVTLVGLLEADLSLHMPDFRAAERTFQLLVQVAGRAGRGDRAGEVVVQSFTPASAPLQFARKANFEGFYEQELAERERFQYPPYRHLICHLLRSTDLPQLQATANQWAAYLKQNLPFDIELRGPIPAFREKVQDHFRYHLWYFTHYPSQVVKALDALRSKFKWPKSVVEVLDVDPCSL
jgi:primosomal protein N' (replication factor Y)